MMRWMMVCFLLCFSLAARAEWQPRPDWAVLFDEAGVSGTILIHSERDDAWYVHDAERARLAFSPASTFKIFNALVALEAGVLADEYEVIRWDGVKRWLSTWNRDHSLASGMRYSVVWFYQDIARRIGQERMDQWLAHVDYGNRDSGGGIDQFWLQGGALRINTEQQVSFIERLARGELPFRPEVQEAVRRITLMEHGVDYHLHAKTGWTGRSDEAVGIGWYVGWVERDGARWFFALNIDIPDESDLPKRLSITRRALASLGALPD